MPSPLSRPEKATKGTYFRRHIDAIKSTLQPYLDTQASQNAEPANYHDGNTSRNTVGLATAVQRKHTSWMLRQREFHDPECPLISHNMARISGSGSHIIIAESPPATGPSAEENKHLEAFSTCVTRSTNIIIALGPQDDFANFHTTGEPGNITPHTTSALSFVKETLYHNYPEIHETESVTTATENSPAYEARALISTHQQDSSTVIKMLHLPNFGGDLTLADFEMMIYLAESYKGFVVCDSLATTLSPQFALAIMLHQHSVCHQLHQKHITPDGFSRIIARYLTLIWEVNPDALIEIDDIIGAVDIAWDMYAIASRQECEFANNLEKIRDKENAPIEIQTARALHQLKIKTDALKDLISSITQQKSKFPNLPSLFLHRDPEDTAHRSVKQRLLNTICEKINDPKERIAKLNSTSATPEHQDLIEKYSTHLHTLAFYFLATAFQRELWGFSKTSSSGELCVALINQSVELKEIVFQLKTVNQTQRAQTIFYPTTSYNYEGLCHILTYNTADSTDSLPFFYGTHREAALNHLETAVNNLDFDAVIPADFSYNTPIGDLRQAKIFSP